MSDRPPLPPRARRPVSKKVSKPVVEAEAERRSGSRKSSRPSSGGGGGSKIVLLTLILVLLSIFAAAARVANRSMEAKEYLASLAKGQATANGSGASGSTSNNSNVAPSPGGSPFVVSGAASQSDANDPPLVAAAKRIPAGVAFPMFLKDKNEFAVPFENRSPSNIYLNDLFLVYQELLGICRQIQADPSRKDYYPLICNLQRNLRWSLRNTYASTPIPMSQAEEIRTALFAERGTDGLTPQEREENEKYDRFFQTGKVEDIYVRQSVRDLTVALEAITPIALVGIVEYQPEEGEPELIGNYLRGLRQKCSNVAKQMESKEYSQARETILQADQEFIDFSLAYYELRKLSPETYKYKAFGDVLESYLSYLGFESGEIDKNLHLDKEVAVIARDLRNNANTLGSGQLQTSAGRKDRQQRVEEYKSRIDALDAKIKSIADAKKAERDEITATIRADSEKRRAEMSKRTEPVDLVKTIGTPDSHIEVFAESFARRAGGKENMVWIELTNSRDRFQDRRILEDLLKVAFPAGDANVMFGSDKISVHAYVKTDQSVEDVVEALDIRFQSETEDRFIVYDLMKKKAKSRRATTKEEKD
ncbi:hypothetical protein [Lacunimicrobium album]